MCWPFAPAAQVHSLDSEEGDALQRLIRAVNCNFLALSATIGNAQQVRATFFMSCLKRIIAEGRKNGATYVCRSLPLSAMYYFTSWCDGDDAKGADNTAKGWLKGTHPYLHVFPQLDSAELNSTQLNLFSTLPFPFPPVPVLFSCFPRTERNPLPPLFRFWSYSSSSSSALQLKDWWTEVQGEQVRDLEVIEAPAGAGEGRRGFVPPSGEVYLEEHSGRCVGGLLLLQWGLKCFGSGGGSSSWRCSFVKHWNMTLGPSPKTNSLRLEYWYFFFVRACVRLLFCLSLGSRCFCRPCEAEVHRTCSGFCAVL